MNEKFYYAGLLTNKGLITEQPVKVMNIQPDDTSMEIETEGNVSFYIPVNVNEFHKIINKTWWCIIDENQDGYVFISADKEMVNVWIEGYRTAAKILKEFIHI
jgi:hypothetical protein